MDRFRRGVQQYAGRETKPKSQARIAIESVRTFLRVAGFRSDGELAAEEWFVVARVRWEPPEVTLLTLQEDGIVDPSCSAPRTFKVARRLPAGDKIAPWHTDDEILERLPLDLAWRVEAWLLQSCKQVANEWLVSAHKAEADAWEIWRGPSDTEGVQANPDDDLGNERDSCDGSDDDMGCLREPDPAAQPTQPPSLLQGRASTTAGPQQTTQGSDSRPVAKTHAARVVDFAKAQGPRSAEWARAFGTQLSQFTEALRAPPSAFGGRFSGNTFGRAGLGVQQVLYLVLNLGRV